MHSWQNGTRCRDGVNVLWCRSHLVWLFFFFWGGGGGGEGRGVVSMSNVILAKWRLALSINIEVLGNR